MMEDSTVSKQLTEDKRIGHDDSVEVIVVRRRFPLKKVPSLDLRKIADAPDKLSGRPRRLSVKPVATTPNSLEKSLVSLLKDGSGNSGVLSMSSIRRKPPRPVVKYTKARNRCSSILRKLFKNVKPSAAMLFLPLTIGTLATFLISSGLYAKNLSNAGNKRLVTGNWAVAEADLRATQPKYETRFAFYKVQQGQTIESLAEFFSVNLVSLKALNPGLVVTGTTIKVPPVESSLVSADSTSDLAARATVVSDGGILRVANKYGTAQIRTNIPELYRLLSSYNAIEQIGATSYRINLPFSIDGNIRVDITKATVSRLELLSTKKVITCLCFDRSIALVDGVDITSYDPDTKSQDTNILDGRSFVRVKDGRLDILNSHLSYLGNALDPAQKGTNNFPFLLLADGGAYGASWRIEGGSFGKNIATGWIENSTFEYSHFGAFTSGASGMVWRSNKFNNNDVYGLDPHDDSNNFLVENNVFASNGKHGFIVSKRCDFNIIRGNVSYNNKGHGFMLHQDSASNLVEENVSYHNDDNFVIFASNFNTIRNNRSYSPTTSHVRVDETSSNTFVTGNKMYGGVRGVYLTSSVSATLISNNNLEGVKRPLQTAGQTETVFSGNTVGNINYLLGRNDRVIFGENFIRRTRLFLKDTQDIDPTKLLVAGSLRPEFSKLSF